MALDIFCAAYFTESTCPIKRHHEDPALRFGPDHYHLYDQNERGRHALLRMHFNLPIYTDFHLSQPQFTGYDGLTTSYAFVSIAQRFRDSQRPIPSAADNQNDSQGSRRR